MDAVAKGDMKTAQRMVDAAAEAAGYNVGPVYHGVRERYRMGTESSPPAILPATKFTKWIASEANFPAFYASRDKAAVERWAKRPSNVMAVYLKAQNTAKEGEIIISSSFLQKEVVDKLKSLGYDSVEGGRDFNAHEIAVFDSSQIKSADPVTYDDSGNVIPLSQRFDSRSDDIRNPYTRPDLRERLKRKIMAGSKGGNPGQWSARKAQLLAAEYEKAGGGYTGKRSASQRSLSKWTKEDWRTKSGKPSLETGERYLPAAAITALTSAEYAETSRAKRKATGQFSRQPKRIAMKTREYRNPMTNAVRKKLAPVIEKDDRILCYDTATGEDFYRLWDIIHTAMPMTKEALVEVEGMLDDDGVLVIESGETPVGLQDHFRRATRYNGLLLVQGPKNPEQARIETEKLRRELE
jgi:hypothetical protein